jgi:hypothetical protein
MKKFHKLISDIELAALKIACLTLTLIALIEIIRMKL